MANGTVNQRLRPLRFAFLVNPNDRAAVLKAIQLSSMLWGGVLNPIVPVFHSRLPRRWSPQQYFRRQKPKLISDGYLEGFDPDFVVPVNLNIEGKVDGGNAEIITPEELLGDFTKDGALGYGISILETAAQVANREFKYVRRAPLNVIVPKFTKSHKLFLSAMFGDPLPEGAAMLKKFFGEQMGISEPSCSISNYPAFLGLDYLFARRLGLMEIDYYPRDATVYCMDATSTLDVIDFWNLRAAGFYVIPAPRQAFATPALQELVKSFVEKNYQPDQHNPDYYFHTSFQVGRGIAQDDVEVFARSLAIPPPEKRNDSKFSIRWWYPRLWDRWARLETDERVTVFFSKQQDSSIRDEAGTGDLRVLSPSFEANNLFQRGARFANELDYRVYGSAEPVAEILPQGSQDLAIQSGLGGIDDFRLSRSGPVHLSKSGDRRIHFSVPKAERFMLSWFADRGWEAQLSQAGLVAKQMLLRLGGDYGIYTIKHEGVVRLLDRHASERLEPNDPQKLRATRWILETALGGEIDRILRQEGSQIDRNRYLASLRERDILRLGLQLHCPTCTRWLWKAISDLDEQIECEHCLAKFSVSAAAANDRQWSFKPVGPFNVRDFAAGAYTSLLTWQFIAGIRDRATTPILSSEIVKDGVKREVDLTLFCNDGRWGAPKVELLLAECKSYDVFGARDVTKMQEIGEHFPEAILVFAKLGADFKPTEIGLLTRLVVRQRRLWRSQKPHNAVLLLTGTELFGFRGAPHCWEGRGGKFEEAYKKWTFIRSLRQLAEITQELYLGVPSQHEWAESERKKRSKRKPAAK